MEVEKEEGGGKTINGRHVHFFASHFSFSIALIYFAYSQTWILVCPFEGEILR